MGFWSSLSALFVRDTVKAYSEAKKEVNAEIKRNDGFIHEFEYLDNESYKKHSPHCINYTNSLMQIIEDLLKASDYPEDKKNTIRRTISAFPYYAVLVEQGGGVHEVQERFLKNIKKSEISYSGEEIKNAATNSSDAIAFEIEANGALIENRLGDAWKDLLAVTDTAGNRQQDKVRAAVDCLSAVAVHFAQMADVIVEDLLKKDIERSFDKNSEFV